MHIIIDAREYTTAPPLTGKSTRATEALVKRIAYAVASDGHRVDVVTAEPEEHYINGVYWWPPLYFPRQCDVLLACERLDRLGEFKFGRLLVFLNRNNPTLAGNEAKVDRFVCFSDNHVETLLFYRPTIKPEQCVVIGPGVDMPTRSVPRIRHRLLWCNSPDRGLIHIARLWPRLVELLPTVTISVTYDFDAYLQKVYWLADVVAEQALEMRDWMQSNPTSVFNRGEMPYEAVITEQLSAEAFVYPADTARPGQLFHCFAALESAAAGCALVLSRTDGLPSVFGEVATFIDDPSDYEAWATGLAALLQDEERKKQLQIAGRTWALPQTWKKTERAWRMLLRGKAPEWTGPGHGETRWQPETVRP